jgi:hypothetical protein
MTNKFSYKLYTVVNAILYSQTIPRKLTLQTINTHIIYDIKIKQRFCFCPGLPLGNDWKEK